MAPEIAPTVRKQRRAAKCSFAAGASRPTGTTGISGRPPNKAPSGNVILETDHRIPQSVGNHWRNAAVSAFHAAAVASVDVQGPEAVRPRQESQERILQ